MPLTQPAVIHFKAAKKRRVIEKHEGITTQDGMLTIFTREPAVREKVVLKGPFKKASKVQEQFLQEVPIVAFPLDDIERVDFGYMTLQDYQARLKAEEKWKKEKEGVASQHHEDLAAPVEGGKDGDDRNKS